MIESMKEWAAKHPDIVRRGDHNDRMHEVEPEKFQLLKVDEFNSCMLRGQKYDFGFCINSVSGGGYHQPGNPGLIWIADDLTEPIHVLECAIHECLHAWFPHLSEKVVVPAGKEIAAFIVGVYHAKNVTLPKLTPFVDKENAEEVKRIFAQPGNMESGKQSDNLAPGSKTGTSNAG